MTEIETITQGNTAMSEELAAAAAAAESVSIDCQSLLNDIQKFSALPKGLPHINQTAVAA